MEKDHDANPQSGKLSINVLILAAGLGTRMKSRKAKVLHELDGRPLIGHVCRAALGINPAGIYVVVGHQAAAVEAAVRDELGVHRAEFVVQEQQRGTADAVMAARQLLQSADGTLVILSGDVPLIRPETLAEFVAHHEKMGAACSILAVKLESPTGYGRIIRDETGRFMRIIEEKDATSQQRELKEINSGFYCFDSTKLFNALGHVAPLNEQREYYLTDVPEILLSEEEVVEVFAHTDALEVSGINTRADLADFESLLRRRTIQRLMLEEGVTFIDPSQAYISGSAEINRDCVIHPGVIIEGNTVVGEACVIHAGTRIKNSKIGNNVLIKDHCVIVDSQVESDCSIGPFAHLRMNAQIQERASVGNFVELKKSRLGKGSKSMHLTYLGDATIGDNTNIGAGTITCNYDGKQKHETLIEDDVKIGSDTMLVAPVKVGGGSVTAAGSVVIEDVPPDCLVAGVPAVIKRKLKNRAT
jgi:bifunctional UDP-N-acetylglucosamine pyrophosphorylase / glucosamine-1-phosphate N-acetyltransferase